MRRDSSFCAKSVRYNIFTNGAPSIVLAMSHSVFSWSVLGRLELFWVVLGLLGSKDAAASPY